MNTAAEVKRARAAKLSEARAIRDKATSEKREMTPDEASQIQALMTAINDLSNRVATLEALEDGEAQAGAAGDDPGMRGGRRSTPLEGRSGGPVLPPLDGKHKYSLLRAFRCINEGRNVDGLEGEVSSEVARQVGKTTQNRGFFLPWSLRTHVEETRGFDTTAGAGGIASILGTDLIDLLRNRMVLKQAGARVLNGMVGGTFSLPKLTQAGTAYWVAESTAPTGSNQTLGQVTFTPRTVGAYTDISRKLMLQTSLDAEAIVREDLALILAIEMDRAGINGSGSSNQPTGILQNSSVTTEAIGTNGGDPTWALIVNLESDVAALNADVGKLAYLTNAKGRGKLKRVVKDANTAAKYLWNEDAPNTPMNGYGAFVSNNVPANLVKGSGTNLSSLLFGNFDSAVFAFWGALEIIADPYSNSTTGGLRIVMLQDCDFQLRYTQSFAKCVDMGTT